jgi:hypothetical protein
MKIRSLFFIATLLLACFQPLSAQETLIEGTRLKMDFNGTGLRISEQNPRLLIDEAREAFLRFEQATIQFTAYEEMFDSRFTFDTILKEEILIRENSRGKIIKAAFKHETGPKIFWLAYLGQGDNVVETVGGYDPVHDSILGDAYLQALRTMRLDEAVTLNGFEDLPFEMDSLYGYTREISYIPESVYLQKKVAGRKQLLFILVDREQPVENPVFTLEGKQERLEETDRTIHWVAVTGPGSDAMESANLFEAQIRYPQATIKVSGTGVFGAERIREFQAMTRNLRLKKD